jgi:hypothetical protein
MQSWHLPPPPHLEVLRPSALARVIACPGSRRLAMKAPPKVSSTYADEGSAAHALAEQCLRMGRAPFEFIGQAINIAGRDWPVTPDMVRAVGHYVADLWGKVRRASPAARSYVEQKLFIAELHNSGTVDHLIVDVAAKTVWVDDYKHGAGVYVGEKWNAQFIAYALGALQNRWPRAEDEDVPKDVTLHLTVHQPRFPDVKPARTHTLTFEEMYHWRNTVMIPALNTSLTPDAPLKGGDHCRFCPAKPICMEYLTVAHTRFQHVPIQAAPVPRDFQF